MVNQVYNETDELMHYGRKGMKWGENIFDDVPLFDWSKTPQDRADANLARAQKTLAKKKQQEEKKAEAHEKERVKTANQLRKEQERREKELNKKKGELLKSVNKKHEEEQGNAVSNIFDNMFKKDESRTEDIRRYDPELARTIAEGHEVYISGKPKGPDKNNLAVDGIDEKGNYNFLDEKDLKEERAERRENEKQARIEAKAQKKAEQAEADRSRKTYEIGNKFKGDIYKQKYGSSTSDYANKQMAEQAQRDYYKQKYGSSTSDYANKQMAEQANRDYEEKKRKEQERRELLEQYGKGRYALRAIKHGGIDMEYTNEMYHAALKILDTRCEQYPEYEDYLEHHGILGMKWGVRKYQNEDGSLTPEGERRYAKMSKGEKLAKMNQTNAINSAGIAGGIWGGPWVSAGAAGIANALTSGETNRYKGMTDAQAEAEEKYAKDTMRTRAKTGRTISGVGLGSIIGGLGGTALGAIGGHALNSLGASPEVSIGALYAGSILGATGGAAIGGVVGNKTSDKKFEKTYNKWNNDPNFNYRKRSQSEIAEYDREHPRY